MNDSEPDIAIIGAGAAGIAAARQLSANNLSVVMLEALQRPGGRSWTHQSPVGPMDLGCGWLHSGGRNPWTRLAEQAGYEINRGPSAWGRQFRNLGFAKADQSEAWSAFDRWSKRLAIIPPASDRASEATEPDSPWTAYLQALSGYISGDELERISARDYAAYHEASTEDNWRLPAGYGTLIAASLPTDVQLHLNMPLQALSLDQQRVVLETQHGVLRPRAVIISVSTNVLAGETIRWPSALDPWRQAASDLPLGNNEKLFLEIIGPSPFEPETHVVGDPHDPATGSYYIRPFGRSVIECFLGGAGARNAAAEGSDAAFARAIDELTGLFGHSVRSQLRPLIASDWTRTASIGGGYSHALPGQAEARLILGQPLEDRIFFAGEATHRTDFSTAHGAFQSGVRAAQEALAALGNPAAAY
ncbi:FAD-dependent oxidoreductase [Rhizobium deserti]|uniref:Tryptophan 2-monooxygenase n=1 Tax=Rhizobium deserti TaxID=2547961 RepID=A0A4R5UJI2_9HYPH|nr:FAD-dependent oxidoreductase [Rhizobium deserti]TDK37021.1 FAD-dependent oxidoreductase [Rhizobium deserti]